ncbi:MAG: TIGR01777 family protein [Candidatus Melainabacteria bacterium]|jgi:uncharacterized protein|nr:TIGR01777 family protein [Candidatus Melainabacteria bacterium]
MTTHVEFSALMPCDSKELYRWHTMPRAINRLIPPWENVKIIEHPDTLGSNSKVHIKLDGFIDWKLRISELKEGESFTDTQISGPFFSWTHKHNMETINGNHSLLVEKIDFKLPLLNGLLGPLFTKNKLEPGFNYRFRVMNNDIKLHNKYKLKPQKILITGTSGLVGTALFDFLSSGGHQVYKLVRKQAQSEDEIAWDPEIGTINPKDLEGFETVIHLAGENIAGKRWSSKQKEKIRASRVNGTKLLAETLSKLDKAPNSFICASAIGFYGDRDNELCDESTEHGKCFLAETCKEWEEACKALKRAGTRCVQTRFGIILDPRSGALAKMLPIFMLGGGGTLGNGKQWMSWIALDDVIGTILHCIATETIYGPVNTVSPIPVTNKEFTRIISKVISRPAILPAPSFGLRLALGEMADALLLSSTKVEPTVLQDTGYDFAYPDLDSALRHMLGK